MRIGPLTKPRDKHTDRVGDSCPSPDRRLLGHPCDAPGGTASGVTPRTVATGVDGCCWSQSVSVAVRTVISCPPGRKAATARSQATWWNQSDEGSAMNQWACSTSMAV